MATVHAFGQSYDLVTPFTGTCTAAAQGFAPDGYDGPLTLKVDGVEHALNAKAPAGECYEVVSPSVPEPESAELPLPFED